MAKIDQRIVVCKTPECSEKNKQKQVRLQFLGQGLYLDAAIICGVCGKRVKAL